MRKKSYFICILLIITCLICACGSQNQIGYLSWLPDGYTRGTTEDELTLSNRKYNKVTTDALNAVNYYQVEDLVDALLNEESDKLAEYLWENQITNGLYSVTEEELNKNMLVYYVSSSEGDDNNLGLSPDAPKKTLGQFTNMNGITVLLKCGDTFDMETGFSAGNECIYATYGTGKRPVVSFYQKLNVTFTKVPGLLNVWKANLVDYPGLYNENPDKDNCNIGQLLIDGEVNWKRVVVGSDVAETFDFPGDLAERADNAWTIDWLQSILYLYSEKDPNETAVYAAPDIHGIEVNVKNRVMIKGWEITGAGAHGCNITDGKDVSITNCYFKNIGGSVHRAAGVRYGNAVQIWNSATNITVAYNYADWIFDSCYTNQGSSGKGDNILFAHNIGAHSFTGIETWGDVYTEDRFQNLVYRDNILFHMCDITDPYEHMFSKSDGTLVNEPPKDTEYISYRGGYSYNQMTCLNVNGTKVFEDIKIYDNIFWNTNRLLVLFGNTEVGYPKMYNNLFYSEITSLTANLFRYLDEEGGICYTDALPVEDNITRLRLVNSSSKNTQELIRLTEIMNKMILGL